MKTRVPRAVLATLLRVSVQLTLFQPASVDASQPVEIEAAFEIQSASSILQSLQSLGVLPESVDASEASASVTFSASGSLGETHATGEAVLELHKAELGSFRAESASATATFTLVPGQLASTIELPMISAALQNISGNSFGYNIRADSLSLDASGSYVAISHRREAFLEKARETLPVLIVEATPARLEIRDIELMLSHLSADLREKSPARILEGTAALPSVKWNFLHPSIGSLSGTLAADLSVQGGRLQVRNMDIRMDDPFPVLTEGRINLDLADRSGEFRTQTRLADTGTLTLSGTATFGDAIRGNVSGELEIEDVESVWPVISPLLGEEAQTWLVGGSLEGTIAATAEGSKLQAVTHLEGDRLQGLSPDVTLGWGGSRFALSATHELTGSELATDASLSLQPGEVLVGGIFFNFEERDLNLRALVSVDSNEQIARIDRAELLTGNGILRLNLSGEASRSDGETRGWLRAAAQTIDLERLYNELAPVFLLAATDDYSLSGLAALDGITFLDSGLTFEGTTEISAATLALANPPTSFNDLDLSLPYRLLIPSRTDPKAPENGAQVPLRDGVFARGNSSRSAEFPWRLGAFARAPAQNRTPLGIASIGSATLAGLPVPGFECRPVLWNNHFELPGGLDFDLLGGAFTLSRFEIDDVLAPFSHILVSGGVHQIDLAALCEALDLPSLRGSVTLDVPEASLEGKDLILPGETRLDIFEGTIRIRDLRIENFLGLSPILAFSADFEGLNLGEITRVIPIGRMEGAVKGHARDFRLSLDPLEPYAFDIRIESDDGPRLPRTISIEAVRTVIEVGDAGDVRLPWLFQFFDRYTYGRLGLHASLRNDVLRLEGLIRRGDISYFMLGAGAARINFIAPTTERGHSYTKIVRTLQTRIRQVRKSGLSGVTME